MNDENKKPFFQFNQLTDTEAELNIDGPLMETIWNDERINVVSTHSFAEKLSKIKGDLTVNINSSGGHVATGLGIYNLLKSYNRGTVTTRVNGWACSAASYVFLAGTKRIMPKASLFFIHNVLSYCSGDANDMKKAAAELEKITQPSIEIYKATSNLDEATIKQMMDDETWLSADECLKHGFATAVIEIKEEVKTEPSQSLVNPVLHLVQQNKQMKQDVEGYKQKVNDLTQKLNETEHPKNSWDVFFEGGK